MFPDRIGKALCWVSLFSFRITKAFTVPFKPVSVGLGRSIQNRVSTATTATHVRNRKERVSVVAPDIEAEMSLEDESQQDTIDIILEFAHKIDETPVGDLEEEDFEFIQPILREVESISESGNGIDGDEVLVAEIIEKLVGRLVDEWQDAIINDEKIDFIPDISDFNKALNAWTRVLGKENCELIVDRVDSIFAELKVYYDSGLESCMPNAITFNAKLKTIAFRRGRGISDEEAMALYDEMQNLGVTPNSETFALLVNIFSGSRDKSSSSVADNFLRKGLSMYPSQEGGICIESFNAVLYSWAKSGDPASSANIESILGLMDEYGAKPDVRSFTIYIDSFAQRSDWDSVKEADNILSKLVDLYLAGELGFEPDVTCWTTVIRGWTRLAKRKRKAAFIAEEVMEKMIVLEDEGKITVKADTVVYLSVLMGYVNARCMEDAERIFGIMEYLWKQGDEEMKPEIRSYTALMEGWTKCTTEGAMSNAEAMLERLLENYEDCEDEVLSGCYRALLFGYTRSNDPLKAEETLKLIVNKGFELDSILFDKVIEAYTNLEDVDKIKNVYVVFKLMESCRKQGKLEANERVYTALIRAIAKESKSGMTEKSQKIIQRMEQLYKDGNDAVAPTIFTYNALLKNCANSIQFGEEERKAAFNIAISTFNFLRSSETMAPDWVTYNSLIKCSYLLKEGPQRDNLIIATTKQYVKNGIGHESFIRVLEEYASQELFRKLKTAL